MSGTDLNRRLREATPPGEAAARARARATVLAAHATTPRRRRRPVRRVLAVAAVATVAAGGLTRPGQAVGEWLGGSAPARAVQRLVQDVVGPRPAPRPAAGLALPAGGRLLVAGPGGLWIAGPSGARTRVGAWRTGTWSPGGLYVAAASGRTLAALDPAGRVRWRLTLGARVSDPRWAPDGTHIAYRAGPALRVVYGNGTHDGLLAATSAAVAPAWRPGAPHALAWAGAHGIVRVTDADTGRTLWARRTDRPTLLAWSGDGRRLLVSGPRGGAIVDPDAGTAHRLTLAGGRRLTGAAWAPRGRRLALAERDPRGDRSEIRLLGRRSPLVAAPGRLGSLAWSPDGRWLIAGWPDADQWLLVRTGARPQVTAVSSVARRFGARGALPRVEGWCCG